MSFYQIDSRQLRSKKEELSGLLGRFIREKDDLRAKEAALGSMWEGAANESFHEKFIASAGQMDAFADCLGRYIGVIESISQRYDDAEMKNIGRAN